MGYLQSKGEKRRIREAAVKHIVDRREGPPMTTISSKNQITLPAHLLRELGLNPGDRLAIDLEGERLVLRPRPRDWVRHYAGSLRGLYGQDRQQADEYVQDLRDETRREEQIEGAWTEGRGPAEE